MVLGGRPVVLAPDGKVCWFLPPACQLGPELGELWLRDVWFPVVESRWCFCLLTGALPEAVASCSLGASRPPSSSALREREMPNLYLVLSGKTHHRLWCPLPQPVRKSLWIIWWCITRTECPRPLSHHHRHHHLFITIIIIIIIFIKWLILGDFLLDTGSEIKQPGLRRSRIIT